jgi:23S rRNA (adenine2030-N6)-methyltransferase
VAGSRSRYAAEGEAPDYSHRFHAGNVGDVWKHCVLIEVLRRSAASGRVAYFETHAGEGSYALAPTGEWTEGIGRLWSGACDAAADGALARYVELCRRLGSGVGRLDRYPGSPAFARAVLGPRAELVLCERDRDAAVRLAEHFRGDAHAAVDATDGLRALEDRLPAVEAQSGSTIVLLDPSYAQKADWTAVTDALASAARRSRACFLLWYPVKSLTRPNAMVGRLRDAGVPTTLAELLTTPLGYRRHRLNGSGVVLVRPPVGAVEAIAAAAPAIGARCATVEGSWSVRVVAFSGREREAAAPGRPPPRAGVGGDAAPGVGRDRGRGR